MRRTGRSTDGLAVACSLCCVCLLCVRGQQLVQSVWNRSGLLSVYDDPANYAHFMEIMAHLDLSDRKLTLYGTWLGRCNSSPPVTLPSPVTTRSQCVLQVQDAAFHESLAGEGLKNLFFLVVRAASQPAEQATLPSVLSLRHRLMLMEDVVIHGNGFAGRAIAAINSRVTCVRCHFRGFAGQWESVLFLRSTSCFLDNSTFADNSIGSPPAASSLAGPRQRAALISAETSNDDAMAAALWLRHSSMRNNSYASAVGADNQDAIVYSDNPELRVFNAELQREEAPWLVLEDTAECSDCTDEYIMHVLGFLWMQYTGVNNDLSWGPRFPFVRYMFRELIDRRWPVRPPNAAVPHASIKTASELRGALRTGTSHITVTQHLDLATESRAGRGVGVGHQTASIVGDCADPYDQSLPSWHLEPQQCVVAINGTAVRVMATHTRRLWLARIYFLMLGKPTLLPFVSQLEEDTWVQWKAWEKGQFPFGGTRQFYHYAPAVHAAHCDMWLTDVVFDASQSVNVSGVVLFSSNVYARRAVFTGFDLTNDHKLPLASVEGTCPMAPLVVEATNATLHGCTFQGNLARQTDTMDCVSAGVFMVDASDAMQQPMVWLRGGVFHNLSTVITPQLGEYPVPRAQTKRREFAQPPFWPPHNGTWTWSAVSPVLVAEAPAVSESAYSGMQSVKVYIVETNNISSTQDSQAVESSNWPELGVMNEDNDWFAGKVVEYANVSGSDPLRTVPMRARPSPAAVPIATLDGTFPPYVLFVAAGLALTFFFVTAGVAFYILRWKPCREVGQLPSESSRLLQLGKDMSHLPGRQPVALPPGNGDSRPTGPEEPWSGTMSVFSNSASRLQPQISAQVSDSVQRMLDRMFQAGELFNGRFRVLSEASRFVGGQGVVQGGDCTQTGQRIVVKFFFQEDDYRHELAFYNNPALESVVPELLDSSSNTDLSCQVTDLEGAPFPPFMVLERGDSLTAWARRVAPDRLTAVFVLCHIVQKISLLHSQNFVHRDLKPANVLWRSATNEWTLIDFGCTCQIGETVPITCTIQYAAPELVEAIERRERHIEASAAVDVWALGLMAYELLTGTKVFPNGEARENIVDCLAGRAEFPWQAASAPVMLRARLGVLQDSILQCLSRNPADRPESSALAATWTGILQRTRRTTDGNETWTAPTKQS